MNTNPDKKNFNYMEQQIYNAVDLYVKQNHETNMEKAVTAAMLSGISLSCNFLVGNDGHLEATPYNLLKGCVGVAVKLGLSEEALQKGDEKQ